VAYTCRVRPQKDGVQCTGPQPIYYTTLIGFIRQLDLPRVLGTQADADELLQLLELIESTDWEFVPESNRSKAAQRRRDFSKGRVGAGGDWVWYNPNTRSVIPEQEARALSRADRVVPQGHPTGYEFDDSRPRASGWFPGSADQPELPPVEVEDEDNLTENTPSDDEIERDVRQDGGWRGAQVTRNLPQVPQTPRTTNVDPLPATPAGLSADHAARRGPGNPILESRRGTPQAATREPSPGDRGEADIETRGVKRFIREVGLSENEILGDWTEMRGYLRAKLDSLHR